MSFLRPGQLEGKTHRYKLPCGTIHITVNTHEDRPMELFLTAGHQGTCIRVCTETIGRLISEMLQGGVGVDRIIHHLEHQRCGEVTANELHILSCMDAIAKVLKEEDGQSTG